MVSIETICKSHSNKSHGSMPNHAPLKLEDFLPYRLSILSNKVSQSIAREYEKRFELTVTEWRVMAVLARFDALSAREVAERTAMDKVAVSRALARLVDAGRVSRRTHDGDKRRSVLRLSAKGWKIHDAVAPLALQHERELLEQLSPAERETFSQILDKLTASA